MPEMIDYTSVGQGRVTALRMPTPVRCPVCSGLECLCRPRYFSGQLLTEADLNAEQEYVIKKNRLHNLYLHGFGVVCGLQVLCHPTCNGWVRIKEGYAISPCGDDVILCKDVDFPLVDRISECLRMQQKQVDCTTPYAATSVDCGTDGCWYITIQYDEQATRAMASLRSDMQASMPSCTCGGSCGCGGSSDCGCGCEGTKSMSSNGCGCGGSHTSNGNGCGCGSSTTNGTYGTNGTKTTTGTPTRTPLGVPCEPTRICEGYKIDICRADDSTPDCEQMLEGTLLGSVWECLLEAQELVRSAPDVSTGDPSDMQAYTWCCSYLQRVRTFFQTHATTTCALLAQLNTLSCSPPQAQVEAVGLEEGMVAVGSTYGDTIAAASSLVMKHVLDCVCLALLPPCPADPGDKRLILACACVRDGQIVEICNLKGRRQVWTWPTIRYWLSAFPVEPLILRALEAVCCEGMGERLLTGVVGNPWADSMVYRRPPTDGCDPLVMIELLRYWMGGFSALNERQQAEVPA
jgi:hypothetical protein